MEDAHGLCGWRSAVQRLNSIVIFGSLIIFTPGTPDRLLTSGYTYVMRPLRYSINVTLDGCCDHRAIPADEELHRHAVENLDQADALLFGRVT